MIICYFSRGVSTVRISTPIRTRWCSGGATREEVFRLAKTGPAHYSQDKGFVQGILPVSQGISLSASREALKAP